MPIKVNGDAVVQVTDVAKVRRTFKDPECFARVDGRPPWRSRYRKRIGENIIETIEQVRARWSRRARPGPTRQGHLPQDRSKDIRTMLGDLENNLLTAVILVMS